MAFRYEHALALADRGLDLAGDDGFMLMSHRAELLGRLGKSKASIETYRQAGKRAQTGAELCQSLIGVAAGVRLLGGSEEGVIALDQAEPLARQDNLELELAKINFYRGTFSFAGGDMEGCLKHQNLALEYATSVGNYEWQARAFGGLGDANYANGRMGTALASFADCISLAREHGFGRIELSNRFVVGVARRYINEISEAFKDIKEAIEMAENADDKRARAYALTIQAEFLCDACDPVPAEASLAQAMEIMEALGNRRFTAYIMNQQARQLLLAGQPTAARERITQAHEISRDTNETFIGPRIFGTTALVLTDAAKRKLALKEGAELLAQGCIAHNHLWFYRDAVDASLQMADWQEALRYADALEAFTQDEPLAWCELFVTRGRALSAWGGGARDDGTLAEIKSIRDYASSIGLVAPVAALEAALAGQ